MAKKYIDADLLRDRIKKNKYVIEPMFLKGDDSYYEGEYDGYNRILSIIDSLQQEQDLKYISEIHRNGYNLCKEQMLKDAVEGYVAQRVHGKLYAKAQVPDEMGLKFGDKVRIVVLKEEE